MAIIEGYDVWLENWRGSIEFAANEWDLDIVAKNDHPAAVKKIIERTGAKEIKAIVHCQGSTSFMISAMLGLLPEVKHIISNAVSLHPVVPPFSVFKLKVLVPIVSLMFKYLNPQWGLEAPGLKTKFLKLLVRLTHWEKDTMVGKFVSFTYGAGFPALWRLENLDKVTMDWIQGEFKNVPMTFFAHIKKCIKAGHLVSNDKRETSYVTDELATDARIILFGGDLNLCFLSESQQQTFDYLESKAPGKHKLYRLEKYSHLDVFFGKNSDKDIFPIMLKELNTN